MIVISRMLASAKDMYTACTVSARLHTAMRSSPPFQRAATISQILASAKVRFVYSVIKGWGDYLACRAGPSESSAIRVIGGNEPSEDGHARHLAPSWRSTPPARYSRTDGCTYIPEHTACTVQPYRRLYVHTGAHRLYGTAVQTAVRTYRSTPPARYSRTDGCTYIPEHNTCTVQPYRRLYVHTMRHVLCTAIAVRSRT
jgi:hypothetical protein